MTTRRYKTIALCLLALSLLHACTKQESTETAIPFNKEAHEQAQAFLERNRSQCRDSFFSAHEPTRKLIEFKDLGILISPDKEWKQSEVDKLNQLEWVGTCSLFCTAYREFNGSWSDWKDGYWLKQEYKGVDPMPVRKKNGQWEFGDANTPRFTPADCATLPK